MLFCSLRALVKYLDNVPEAEIVELNIPTGIPLVYELDADLKPIRHYYLGDEVSRGTMAYSHWREILNTHTQEAIKAAIAGVAAQGKAK